MRASSRASSTCKNASLGTSMTGGYTVWNGKDATTLDGKGVFGTNVNILPSVCTYCLTMGWGTSDATPGYYVPCGCQRTCVDVSGNSYANFMNGQLNRMDSVCPNGAYSTCTPPPPATTDAEKAKGSQPLALGTCADYLSNGIVASCTSVGNYHIVLWPSLAGTLILLYVAYTMAYMQLDMDSLLYEPEPTAHSRSD